MGFDKSAKEFIGDWIPKGFQESKPRRPLKKNVPEWIYNDKDIIKKLCEDAKLKYRIAYLYWRLGWTAKEIAIDIYGTGGKINTIESILYRIKNM